jgi:hypothetical protein
VTSLGQTVRDKLKQAHERLEAGAPVRDATRTVGDWLAQWRTTTLAASGRKESAEEAGRNAPGIPPMMASITGSRISNECLVQGLSSLMPEHHRAIASTWSS